MAQVFRPAPPRGRISLTVRLSLLILAAALLPLAAVVGITTYLPRYGAHDTLINQGNAALTTDARAKTDLLELYFGERAADGQALATLETVAPYILCSTLPLPPDALKCYSQGPLYLGSNTRALKVGLSRDSNYSAWALFDARGTPLLAYNQPTKGNFVPLHADEVAPVRQQDLKPVVLQGQSYVSPVYYDPSAKRAYVQMYAPIFFFNPASNNKSVVGFLRATLNLDYVWGVVNGEKGADGEGSYAFITDENGVRVASAHEDERFTSVKSLDQNVAKQIATEKRYGNDSPVPQIDLPQVASAVGGADSEQSFQSIAAPDSKMQYQFVGIHLKAVPWTYFVLSPTDTVTQVASDQVRNALLSAAVIAVIAVLIGLLIGSGMTRPVQRSVAELEGAAVRLHGLASRQQESSGEQHWVVDACQTGLESVRYLSDAMHQAARRVLEASNWFGDYWDRLTEEQAKRTVSHLQELAHYIDEAARRQQASSDRLGKAITVTRQVSDQLVGGAGAATESAEQLEQVVYELHRVVGGRARTPLLPSGDREQDQMAEMGGMGQMGGMGMSAPASRPGVSLPYPELPPSLARQYGQMSSPASGWGGNGPASGWGGDFGAGAGFGSGGSYGGGQSGQSGWGGDSGYGRQGNGPASGWGNDSGWGQR